MSRQPLAPRNHGLNFSNSYPSIQNPSGPSTPVHFGYSLNSALNSPARSSHANPTSGHSTPSQAAPYGSYGWGQENQLPFPAPSNSHSTPNRSVSTPNRPVAPVISGPAELSGPQKHHSLKRKYAGIYGMSDFEAWNYTDEEIVGTYTESISCFILIHH